MDAIVLYPEIGRKADAADSAGSLHAKLKALANTDFGTTFHLKTPTVTKGNAIATSHTNYVDIISITGPRVLLGCVINLKMHGRVKVIIDNATVFDADYNGDGVIPTIEDQNGTYAAMLLIQGPFRFSTSFVVQVCSASSEYNGSASVFATHIAA